MTDAVEGSPLDAGQMVLSATRTYAPVVQAFLKDHRAKISGMVHCSGGAQTKALHFLNDGLHVVKDNMFDVPVLFETIQRESGTSWEEMYKVFNMGHRLEVYTDEETAREIIKVSESFGIAAQIIGRVEVKEGKAKVTVNGPHGTYTYS